MGGNTQVHVHTYTMRAQDFLLLPCQPCSRDATIKALELDLAAAPKQERMDQLVRALECSMGRQQWCRVAEGVDLERVI